MLCLLVLHTAATHVCARTDTVAMCAAQPLLQEVLVRNGDRADEVYIVHTGTLVETVTMEYRPEFTPAVAARRVATADRIKRLGLHRRRAGGGPTMETSVQLGAVDAPRNARAKARQPQSPAKTFRGQKLADATM